MLRFCDTQKLVKVLHARIGSAGVHCDGGCEKGVCRALASCNWRLAELLTRAQIGGRGLWWQTYLACHRSHFFCLDLSLCDERYQTLPVAGSQSCLQESTPRKVRWSVRQVFCVVRF